jgi:hypothetical protein
MSGILLHPFLLLLCSGFVLFFSTFVGYRLALITGINEDAYRHEHIVVLREGLFVLLALLLGFMVAMVLPRFDQRRDLELEEAHSISAAWLQAQALPEPQRQRSLQLLREYVTVRRQFSGSTLGNPAALNANTEQTKALQEQLWHQYLEVEQQNQTVVVATYGRTLSEMIGVPEKRLAAFENRVPAAVWIIILVVAAFQSFITGYSMKRKIWFSLTVTPIVIAVVIALIADLDDPHSGLIRVEQNSMNRVANELVER